MGQKLQDDRIGQLSESGGIITLAPSVLTIGGQQYITDSLNVPVPSFSTILELHFIYAVLSSGNTILVTSQNINSVGPVGFNAWKLIGAFYSGAARITGTLQFGSFVSIDGAPETEQFQLGPITLTSSSGTPNKGTGVTEDMHSISRRGDKAYLIYSFRRSGGSGQTNGNGNWLVQLPSGLSFSTPDKMPTNTGTSPTGRIVGSGHISTGGDGRDCGINIDFTGGGNYFTFQYADGTNLTATSTSHPFDGSSWEISLEVEIAISEWNNVPLREL